MPRRTKVSGYEAAIDSLDDGTRSVAEIARVLRLPYKPVRYYLERRRAQQESAVAAAEQDGTPMGPIETFQAAFGLEPTDYQAEYLLEERPTLVLKGRQTGYTTAAAALALTVARSKPGALAVIISQSLRQAAEPAMRARVGAWELGERLVQDSVSVIRLRNGGRVLSLPSAPAAVRGYACDLVVLDEAAFIEDGTYEAARPLVAATGGRLIAQSTPGLPVGWFHALATATPEGWLRQVVRSDRSPKVTPEFLERERAELTPEVYAMEYEATFGTTVGAGIRLWSQEAWDRVVDPAVPTLAETIERIAREGG